MPPSKRKTRKRQAGTQAASAPNNPTSSPSRSMSKRRKVNGGRVSARLQSISPDPEPSDYHGDSTDNELSDNKDLVDSVVSYLSVAKETPGVAKQHANELSSASNAQKVSAYAKLAGRDWTYYVQDQTIIIGRRLEDDDHIQSNRIESSPAVHEAFNPHIDLAPSKFVSRNHASITYTEDGWLLKVSGRNGVRINNILIKKSFSQLIKSGDVLEIAGTQMMFVLPNEEAVIHSMFIDKAKQMINAGEERWGQGLQIESVSHAHPEPQESKFLSSANLFSASNGQAGQPALAPAPPQMKRATTPPASRKSDLAGSQHSPAYSRGMMMESTQDVDYSLDSAKDLKPPFSYATLIAQAIFSDPEEQRSLSHIYQWIQDKYAFYRHTTTGWQNSIRHNLSLSKAFEKVPRKTNEPGKGMKWRVVPEAREEQLKKLRGKIAASSPNSPAGSNAVNPNFRGPNGQPLGYDSSYAGQFQLNDHQSHAHLGSVSQIPMTTSPLYSSQQHREAFTPERGGNARSRRNTMTADGADDVPTLEDSPLPPNSRSRPAFGLSAQSPPALSSSYLDTPFRNPHSLITPAPVRQNVQLAPPSTLVAPSKFMPESSPAGPGSFPFFMKGIGSTPAGPQLPEISPLKRELADDDRRDVMSSSPPPVDTGSPSRKPGATPSSLVAGGSSAVKASSRRTEVNGLSAFGPQAHAGADDEDEDIGFDLARGFQPIGSFSGRSESSSQPPLKRPAPGTARASS